MSIAIRLRRKSILPGWQFRLSKTCLAESLGGKDRGKGNRQGFPLNNPLQFYPSGFSSLSGTGA